MNNTPDLGPLPEPASPDAYRRFSAEQMHAERARVYERGRAPPEGWVVRRNEDHSLTITGPVGGVVVHRSSIGPREIPEEVLYALASDMLAAPPAASPAVEALRALPPAKIECSRELEVIRRMLHRLTRAGRAEARRKRAHEKWRRVYDYAAGRLLVGVPADIVSAKICDFDFNDFDRGMIDAMRDWRLKVGP